MAEEFDWFQRQDGASPKASDGASSQDDALDWARQAFARLKAQQEAAKAEPEPEPAPTLVSEEPTPAVPEPAKEPDPEPAPTPV